MVYEPIVQRELTVAFKEWAIVVDALGQGEQIIILRKGGIHETRGQFRPEQDTFWLFPTQFHEDERSVIASKRPALREIARTSRPGEVDIRYLAEVDSVYQITDLDALKALQGRHIWSEHVLEQRFQFGRGPGLFALLVRVWQRPDTVCLPVRESYGGCKSWIELERPLLTADLTPVLTDEAFAAQRNELTQRLTSHGLAYSSTT